MCQQPMTLHIPCGWLDEAQSFASLLQNNPAIPRSLQGHLLRQFALHNDEERFVKALLRRKRNLWVFRSHQQQFCGDFVVVDMSSPSPRWRKAVVIDLKQGAPLKRGGGGAGNQLINAAQALKEIAEETGIIQPDSPYELLSGDRHFVLHYLGFPETPCLPSSRPAA